MVRIGADPDDIGSAFIVADHSVIDDAEGLAGGLVGAG
jgi:hypothetical protein